jgi:CPA2 family monovalent cation:H+ antiporter-2
MAHGFQFVQDLAVVLVVATLVGWFCQRIGLSVVVGFLAAGMLIGPHTPPATLVSDVERIETLSQIGLIFLMFSIGLGLSLRKLRRLGPGMVLATFAGAVVMYHLTRFFGFSIGWDSNQGLFLAGMLMVSSSAIISKVLHESGANHERAGQLAMGVSVLEDVVAVVMLTLLGSMANVETAPAAGVMGTLVRLGAFVVMAGVGGLLGVPWLLRKMSIAADEELQTMGVAALLLGLAVVAQASGYSLALGAFLLGVIVAETLHRHQVERTFEGMRAVFSAVFFVAIGLQIDWRQLWQWAGLIALVSAFTLVARPLAVSAGLTLIGTPLRDALRTGLTATPIGEFSFVIAQLGVAHALVPARFYPLAVGVSLVTALLAPLLTRRSAAIAGAIDAHQPVWLGDWLRAYHGWLGRFEQRRTRNLLWQLSRRRVIQVAIGTFFVTGLVVYSDMFFELLEGWLGRDWLFPHGLEVIFWLGVVLAVVAPLLAIWRNLSAMSLLYAEVVARGHANAVRMQPVVETVLKLVAAAGIAVWLAAILPFDGTTRWLVGVGVAVALLMLLILRRKLIYWHSELEVDLLDVIEPGDARMTSTSAPWLRPHAEWSLHMIDCTLPDLADCQGKRISDLALRKRFGCTVVGIERQGFMISLPTPDAVLYPRDKVLLMGTTEQVQAGRAFLTTVSDHPPAESIFDDVRMEVIPVNGGSPAAGHSLKDVAATRAHGVQIAGIRRQGTKILNPSGEETICTGDDLLVLGTAVQIDGFKAWVRTVVGVAPAENEGITF